MKIIQRGGLKIIARDTDPRIKGLILVILGFPVYWIVKFIKGDPEVTEIALFVIMVGIPIAIDILLFIATKRIYTAVDTTARTFTFLVKRFFVTKEQKIWSLGDLKEFRVKLSTKVVRISGRRRTSSHVNLVYVIEAVNRGGEILLLSFKRNVVLIPRWHGSRLSMPGLAEVKALVRFVDVPLVLDTSQVGADKENWSDYTKAYVATGVLEQQIERVKQEVDK